MKGYTSRRIAQAVSNHGPVITADVEASTVYFQQWEHVSGNTLVEIMVLALDADMAEEMGGIRLHSKGHAIMEWKLIKNRPMVEARHSILACITIEDPDETKLREDSFRDRQQQANRDAVDKAEIEEAIAYENKLSQASGRY